MLVFDFSLYADITTLLMGGTARAGLGAAMKGGQVTAENTTAVGPGDQGSPLLTFKILVS